MTLHGPQMSAAAELLHACIGLKPDPSFRPRLARAMRDTATERNVDRDTLIDMLRSDDAALDALVDRVTVQETAFFRHPEQFETIAQLLPTMSAPLRAWSAACANGQEAYSLAMVLSELSPAGSPSPSVLATDVSPAALARTVDGRYSERELAGVHPVRRSTNFTALATHEWGARPALRQLVRVQRHNLLDAIPDEVATCQIVMCRNVLIYFSQQHAASFLDRLADVMQPDAYLFVGGAETLWQMTDRFEPLQLGAGFAYRRRTAQRSRAASPVPTRTTTTPRKAVPAAAPAAVPIRAAGSSATVPAAEPLETTADLEHQGRAALARGDLTAAIVAFRRWAYLAPDDPLAHFHLGSALDEAYEATSARRAFRAALSAMDRCDGEQLERCLQGFDPSALRRLLTERTSVPT
jgi:chemotaxis protein methyltransferase CheR